MQRLLDKSYRNYSYLSRYASFPTYYNVSDNRYQYGTWGQLDKTTPYTLYLVKEFDTFDAIALDHYNNPSLYWIICSFNDIQDCFSTPIAGTYLKIPTLTRITFIHE